jgi:uncharacterized membrane protein YdfJ with MMPL/SSD domain
VSDDLVKKYWPDLATGPQTRGGSLASVETGYGSNTGTLTLVSAAAQLTAEFGAPVLQVVANLTGISSLAADATLLSAARVQPPSSPQSQGLSTASTIMSELTREEHNAKLDAVRAETDTKIARLEGKLDLVLSKLDDVRADNRHTRNNQIAIGIALAILIVGVVAAALTVAPAIFDLGSKFHETIIKEIHEQMSHPTSQ